MSFNTVNFGMAKQILGIAKPILNTDGLDNAALGAATLTNEARLQENLKLQEKINYHTDTQDGSVVKYPRTDGSDQVRFLTLKENTAHKAGKKMVTTVEKQLDVLRQLITDLKDAGQKDVAKDLEKTFKELSDLVNKVSGQVDDAVLLTEEDFTSRPTQEEAAVTAATTFIPEPFKKKFKDVVDVIWGQ